MSEYFDFITFYFLNIILELNTKCVFEVIAKIFIYMWQISLSLFVTVYNSNEKNYIVYGFYFWM